MRDWQTIFENLPVIRAISERVYEKRFATNGYGCFRGIFPNFDAAARSAPRTKPLGFNNEVYAREFEDRLFRALSFDYPVMFWIRQLIQPGFRLFDYGGHRGTNFHAYAQYMTYPENFEWMVCDLPEVIKAGKELAKREKCTQISFTESFADASGADILLAAGSLQYIESPPFAESLAQLPRRPTHLLLNKLPLYEGKQYVTLQNGGPSFHPQYVFNRQEFVESIGKVGYKLADQWEVPSHPCRIPFHPAESFPRHSGLYFRLDK